MDRTNGCVLRRLGADRQTRLASEDERVDQHACTNPSHPAHARSLLNAFENHQWKAYQLRDAVPLKPASALHGHDLARFGQDGAPPGGDGYTLDPEDKDRAEHELKAFKVSDALHFLWR